MFCSHDRTDYRLMYWYQRSPGDTAMKHIGYLYYKEVTMEEPYKDHFSMSGDLGVNTAKSGSLIVTLTPEHSAVYYCAASEQGGAGSEAYFGKGTKLTVLEPGLEVTGPTVKVLRPSPKECQNQRDQKKKKTIVCVASGFYPDHVGVLWKVDGVEVTTGVATDTAALRVDKSYRITSRLRVSAKDWFTDHKEFTCSVSFFNGTHTEIYSRSILGEKGVLSREKYLRITQTAKVSYGVFIIKSSVYGVFVAFLVWKLQSSAGKQSD